MAFHKRRASQMPEINLIPMIDVLMTVLTFFIIISMVLTTDQGVEVPLPSNQPIPETEAGPPPVLVVELDARGQLFVEEEPFEQTQLMAQLRLFLRQDEDALVVLQASQQLPYEQVLQTLADLKAVGGDRISLAIE